MQYTEKELAALIKTVETEFNAELKKTEADMASASSASQEPVATEDKLEKAEKEKDATKEESSEEKAPEKAPAGHEDKADEAAEEEPEAGHAKEHDPAHKEDQEAEEAKEEHNPEHHDYDEEDLAEMHKMYHSMSKGELKAHHDACRSALDKCGDMAMMEKSEVIEVKTEETKPAAEVTLLKSEIEAEKAKNAELKKSFDLVSEILTKLVKKSVPQGKAITTLDSIAKSEPSTEKALTKSEITEILKKKDPGSMSKADRDAITSYYMNDGNINSINHLLR